MKISALPILLLLRLIAGEMCFAGIPIDDDEIKAAERGDADAQRYVGQMYYYNKDYKQAVEWLTKSAEQGNGSAEFMLASMYLGGAGVEKDNEKAIKWFTKLAEQGYACHQCFLADRYKKGDIVLQDYKQAVKWYTKAAEQGYAEAQYDLARMYDNGMGVKQDLKQSVNWCAKAALQDYAFAQLALAFKYFKGDGVEQDSVEAYAWALHAAVNGDSDLPKFKDELLKILSPEQIEAGQARAKVISEQIVKEE